MRARYQGWPLVILYYGDKSLKDNKRELDLHLYRPLTVSWLTLSSHLKLCWLYFTVFPEPSEISTRQLYQLWIAESFIPDNCESTAEEYLKELIDRGFIQVKKRRSGGTAKACSLPGIFTWYVQSKIAYQAEFCFLVAKRQPLETAESWKYLKRVSFFDVIGFIFLEHSSDTYLHSLMRLSSRRGHLAIVDGDNICKKFKFLRVLNLGSLVFDQFPNGLENLIFLKYLMLNIPSLKSLPSSLCNLPYLYTLDMPSSFIECVPDEFWKMQKLRYLNFGYITLPVHPGKYCSSLENLTFISTLHVRGCTRDILGRIPNLQSLRIRGDLSYYHYVLSRSLGKLSCLESLKLVNECKTPQHSHILLVEYQFPQSVTHLSFSNTELKDDPMPALEKLPHLQVLKLKRNSYSGRKLVCSCGGFPQLEVLHLKSMLWLEEWKMETGAMPKLKSLTVNPCAYLRKFPEELWRIKTLRKLESWWPCPELRQSLRKFEEMERLDMQLYPIGI